MTRVTVDAEALAELLKPAMMASRGQGVMAPVCHHCNHAGCHADDCPVPTLQAALAEAQGGSEGRRTPAEAFARLQEVSGDAWDGVNPVDPTPPQPQPAPEVERLRELEGLVLEWARARTAALRGNDASNAPQFRLHDAEMAMIDHCQRAAALASSRGEG